MSLITISALVNADAEFPFHPYGVPTRKSVSVNKTAVTGIYQIIYDNVFEGTPVVTATPAWLGTLGSNGGLTLDNAVINELKQSYVTVKTGDDKGNGTWRPFTIVITGYAVGTRHPHPHD